MIPRFLRLSALCLIAMMAMSSAAAQEAERTIDVLDVSGPLDHRLAQFVIDSIHDAEVRGNVELIVLQIDSPGAVATEPTLTQLAATVQESPVPIVGWVGPAPATAQGAIAQVFALAPIRAAAPGASIGLWQPTIAGRDHGFLLSEPPDAGLVDGSVEVEEPIPGLIDLVSPQTASIRQLVQELDGFELAGAVLETIESFTGDDGEQGVTALTTVIREPGLWDRFLRLASTPEATFFYLIAGLTIAAFEFYAIGPGIAAAVAAVLLVMAGYGLATLPVRWWAVGLAIAAVLLLSISYQLGGVFALNGLGLLGLLVAGRYITATGPQFEPGWPSVILTTAGAAFFFLLAMPTVARSRFSTQTIGREAMIGRSGRAVSALEPDGLVEVDGATWKATSHREAGIREHDAVVVVGVDGWYLEVEPASIGEEE
ncbi:MAG: hypothetical protein OEW30_15910 [Acidimicrobiia bacterium]|nr:hypothetical protein [Acidimicrobiia bacterium]